MIIRKIIRFVIVAGCIIGAYAYMGSVTSKRDTARQVEKMQREQALNKIQEEEREKEYENVTHSGFNVDSYVRISKLINDLKGLEFGLDYHMSASKHRQIMEQANKIAEEILDLVYSAKQDISERIDKTTDIKTIDYLHERENEFDEDIEEVESILDKYKNWEFEAN